MRVAGILAMDVLVFMVLFIIGAAIQSALPWLLFAYPFFFLPAFLYVSYRDPDRLGTDTRGLLWMTIAVSVAMGVVFDIMRFPVDSPIATLLIVGMISFSRPYCFPRLANKSSQRST